MSARACLNCGAVLAGPYCVACGQHDLALQRPFTALAGDFFEAAFNLESRALRTLVLMLALPGLVTRRYLDGHRARYVGPVKMYLLLTFLFFVVLNLSGIGLLVIAPEDEG